MIKISIVSDKKRLHDFVCVPNIIYSDDPLYRPQLILERLEHLSPKNPYFKHAIHQFLIAYDNSGTPVGRISAQIDNLTQKEGAPKVGHFGFLDAKNEMIAHALLNAAQDWLLKNGVKKVMGPYSLSINDEAGLLVDGFDTPPRMMMNHSPQWVEKALENFGFKHAKDLIAFSLDVSKESPKAALALVQKAITDPDISFRKLDKGNMEKDLGVILDIFNKAWAKNWGFVQMTADEMIYTANNMKPLINPDLVHIAYLHKSPVAMIVALPDLNEAIEGLKGKLLPFGWAKLLWRLKIRGVKGARILLMGLLPEHQNGFLGSAIVMTLIEKVHDGLRKSGFHEAELSWILSDNAPMMRLAQNVGATPYKKYRIYEKMI